MRYMFSFVKGCFNFIIERSEAKEMYENVVPIFLYICDPSKLGRDSNEAKVLAAIIVGTVQFGARRENFKRRYIDNPQGWKDLPRTTDELDYGFW